MHLFLLQHRLVGPLTDHVRHVRREEREVWATPSSDIKLELKGIRITCNSYAKLA